MRALENKVLYEAEVAEVKQRHRRKRNIEVVYIYGFEILVLFLMIFMIGYIVVPFYVVGALLFLPSPFILIPNRYTITKDGLIYCDGRIKRLKKVHKVNKNEKDEFVSVLNRFEQEFIRLYTLEPDRVHQLLEELIIMLPE